MSERLTLATSTGLPFLLVAFHVAMGTAALTTGLIAIAARKGGPWHRRGGLVFVATMIATGLTAVGIALYEGKEDVAGGALTAYLVFTAWTAVRPLPRVGRVVDIALMALAFTFAAGTYLGAFTALGRPGNQLDGVPAGMLSSWGRSFCLQRSAISECCGRVVSRGLDGLHGISGECVSGCSSPQAPSPRNS